MFPKDDKDNSGPEVLAGSTDSGSPAKEGIGYFSVESALTLKLGMIFKRDGRR